MLLLLIFFLILASIREILFWIYLWQMKEYRIDRMYVYLRWESTETIVNTRKIFEIFTSLSLFLLYGIKDNFTHPGSAILIIYLCIFSYFFLESVYLIYTIITKKLIIPKLTAKVTCTFITILIFLSSILIFFYRYLPIYLFLKFLIPIICSLAVLFVNIPFFFIKFFIIRRARKKIARMKNITSVLITGSFGKSSTKEFLYEMLKRRFRLKEEDIVKTPENTNTEIGIANIIRNHITENTKYFIVEAGAYRKSEIAKIAKMILPKYGIITGIDSQHVALFGSEEKIIQTKTEFIKYLPDDGCVITTKNTFEKIQNAKINISKPVIITDLSSNTNSANQLSHDKIFIRAFDIEVGFNELSFTVDINHKEAERFLVFLPGKHYIENILNAGSILYLLGTPIKLIAFSCGKISPSKSSLSIFQKDNFVFAKDVYNFSLNGFSKTCEYLSEKIFEEYRKILIVDNLTEFGKKSHEAYENLAKIVQEHRIDCTYYIGSLFRNVFRKSMEKANIPENKYIVGIRPKDMKTKYEFNRNKLLFIFEGKKAEIYFDAFMQQ